MRSPSSPPHKITQLLAEWSERNQAALDQLYPLVYEELLLHELIQFCGDLNLSSPKHNPPEII
jgi:hypothetical protein